MYIVVACANASDTSFPSISPRIVTENPKLALEVAREALRTDAPFLSRVLVFRMDTEVPYSAHASSGTQEHPSQLLVFLAWMNFPYKSPEDTKEKFFHDFAALCEE